MREVRLTLDGDMERYVWFLDGTALWEDDTIRVRAGEVVRFVMVNRTMMHHPMHLHGHFFRVVNGQGDRAPLKHTVDVAPMSTTVIEFAADELGDWLFHCHLLYHMESGMARVVRYEGYDPGPSLVGGRGAVHEDHGTGSPPRRSSRRWPARKSGSPTRATSCTFAGDRVGPRRRRRVGGVRRVRAGP